ncbi:hypothetical protein BDZ97DRAFT_1415159 [Flammula alnicola]|nr:hypothetical protein BDZ97DRAFT_1415159 [Flammula alnicola]
MNQYWHAWALFRDPLFIISIPMLAYYSHASLASVGNHVFSRIYSPQGRLRRKYPAFAPRRRSLTAHFRSRRLDPMGVVHSPRIKPHSFLHKCRSSFQSCGTLEVLREKRPRIPASPGSICGLVVVCQR